MFSVTVSAGTKRRSWKHHPDAERAGDRRRGDVDADPSRRIRPESGAYTRRIILSNVLLRPVLPDQPWISPTLTVSPRRCCLHLTEVLGEAQNFQQAAGTAE